MRGKYFAIFFTFPSICIVQKKTEIRMMEKINLWRFLNDLV